MSELKLTYYNLRAHGETARLILAQAGIHFEDERLELGGPGLAGLQAEGELRYNQVCLSLVSPSPAHCPALPHSPSLVLPYTAYSHVFYLFLSLFIMCHIFLSYSFF